MTGCRTLIAISLLAGGCAGTVNSPSTSATGGGDTIAARLEANRNGLEVRELLFDGERRDALLNSSLQIDTAAVDSAAVQRLLSNEIDVRVVDADRVRSALQSLETPTFDKTTWHGQATEWREVQVRPIAPSPITAIVDGAPRRIQVGQLMLLARGWTIEREDGPWLELELKAARRNPPSKRGRLSTVLERERSLDEAYASSNISLLLRPGQACVVSAASADGAAARVGPDAAMPPSLGRLLLGSDAGNLTTHASSVLIFIPHFTDQSLVFASHDDDSSLKGTNP